jgi:hypothetical protein
MLHYERVNSRALIKLVALSSHVLIHTCLALEHTYSYLASSCPAGLLPAPHASGLTSSAAIPGSASEVPLYPANMVLVLGQTFGNIKECQHPVSSSYS